MNRLYQENQKVFTEEGIKVRNRFQELVDKFYNECRDKDMSILEIKDIMYSCISILPMTELLRNNE
jgi:hypothetical protein